jgi:photosystem II stability/assembly factor-like uncharacterized protein
MIPALPYVNAVASSADGLTLHAVSTSVYRSTDAGVTWRSIGAKCGFVRDLAASADGGQLLVAAQGDGSIGDSQYNGTVYTWQSKPAPRIFVDCFGLQIRLSWLVPSFPCRLEMSADPAAEVWIPVEARPELNFRSLQEEVVLPITTASTFWRLASEN